jgi:hypothetical protein
MDAGFESAFPEFHFHDGRYPITSFRAICPLAGTERVIRRQRPAQNFAPV